MDEEDTNKYERPSELLESVIDVESSPAVLVSPTGEWAVILRYRMLNLDLKDLSQDFVRTAGLSFDPKLMIPEKTVFARSIHLKKIFDSTTGPVVEEEQEVQGLDAYDGFRYFSWHPEGKGIVFTARKRSPGGNDRLDLMMVSIESATSGNWQTFTAKPLVTDRTLTAVVGSPSKFIGDGSHIICFVRPEGLGPAPKEPEVAQGPTIKENLSTKKVPARTYQRLITSKHKRDLFEHYARSDVMVLRIDANDGSITRHTLIQNEMVRSVSLSPDGRLLLVSVTRKPFSWTLPYSKFAKDIQVFQVSQALSKYPPPLSHSKALGKHPAYPERSAVETVSFDSPCESYSPVDFTHPVVFANDCTEKQGGWADPPVEKLTAQELEERFSYHGRIFLKDGVPQNPVGRTGMTGRGLLGKWGPNHAADAIVTRFHQGKLQMVAIQRKDTGNWAIPGGMVDPGESVPAAMKREFMEEAGNLDLTPAEAEEHKRKVDRLFSNGYEIYRGYVDDPRNTDNAWMESSFVHFHCDDELGESLKLEAGDDAGAVTWLDIDESKDAFKNLYASHKEMVLRAAQRLSKTSAGVGVRDGDIHITDRKVIISLPDQEGVPISFDARMRGPRGFGWHWQKPHTLLFRYALDKGDPKAPSVNGMRDALYMLQAPFRLSQDLDVEPASASEDVSPVFQAEYRISSVRWAKASRRLGIVSESWHKTRRVRTWLVKEGPSDGEFVAGKLFERSSDDAYASPGSPLVAITRDGLLELQQGSKDGAFEFLGSGASPIGSRPFYDKVSVDETFAGGDQVKFKTERLWRCTFAPDADTALIDLSKEVGGKLVDVSKRAAVWEDPEEVIGDGEWVLLTRESNDEPANYFWHHVPSGKEWQLTSFAHPQPSLVGVQTSLVSYERLDGVELNGELYMPSGYEPARDGPRPCLLWSYPREFKAKETAGQVKTSPHKFTSTSWARPLLWVLKGWNVLSFSSPIVGEGDSEPNDTFVEQVQLNARAAVEFLIDRNLGKVGGFAVGGHSYGAFMTSHLLAHTDFFSAGIARSGAYLRALTPFGFQAEERSFWEAPETYMELSPFSHAPKIAGNGGKLLLIHGMDDENSGTFPMQSERLYDALKGHGGVTKLVLLPKEGHGYVARESILHTVAEQERWLDRYVVADFDKLPVRSLPPTSPVSRVPRKLASSAGVVNPMMANRAHHLVALTVALIAGVAVYRAARL